MQGSELVIISWSEPFRSGKNKGASVSLGVLDIDLNVKDAFSEKDIAGLKEIWGKYGKLIFPGEAPFEPKG